MNLSKHKCLDFLYQLSPVPMIYDYVRNSVKKMKKLKVLEVNQIPKE
jgi:hypothetical protein